jgi:hypothetical protein
MSFHRAYKLTAEHTLCELHLKYRGTPRAKLVQEASYRIDNILKYAASSDDDGGFVARLEPLRPELPQSLWIVVQWPLAAVYEPFADDWRVDVLDFIDLFDLDPP